jgi:hypothetical protein
MDGQRLLSAGHRPATGDLQDTATLQLKSRNDQTNLIPLEPGCAPCYRRGMTKPVDGGPAGSTDTEEDEDTIELELSAEQLLALSQAAAANEPSAPALQPVAKTKAPAVHSQIKGLRLDARHAAILGIAAASVVLSSVVYLATTGARPARLVTSTVSAPAAPDIPPPLSADNVPVQIPNPFDAAEVFEFPPGTSELEARDAVAEMLLQRARDRQSSWQKVTHARQQAEDKSRPAAATKLAQRGW